LTEVTGCIEEPDAEILRQLVIASMNVVVREGIDCVHCLRHQIPVVGKSFIGLNGSQAFCAQLFFVLVQRD
jgi:hypothetical protein